MAILQTFTGALRSWVVLLVIIMPSVSVFGQPWTSPIVIATSRDGVTFDPPTIFQDSSGVPSAIRWHGDTLICVFQWCHPPVNSLTWDKVAVKFSYDRGIHWTAPQPIVVQGLPAGYQRPFDPTIVSYAGDSLRLYYSSSNGMAAGSDSIIDTYSARSADGNHYVFEANARVNYPTARVIDPAVIYFNNIWHYLSPVGAPQEGAYHYLSSDGINFNRVINIGSDPQHNWTGNYVLYLSTQLRFYGSGPFIWYNQSTDGRAWNGYINTNLRGGDPTVMKLSDSSYLAIFVGPPYLSVKNESTLPNRFGLDQNYPNPFNAMTSIGYRIPRSGIVKLTILDLLWREVAILENRRMSAGSHQTKFNASHFSTGIYFYRIETNGFSDIKKMVVLK